MTFQETGLREELIRALEENEHHQPTPIQAQGIPPALAGRDLICCAQTGTGKTAAFALPILHLLSQSERAPIRALILVPTRELALQVGKSLELYGTYLEIQTATVYGGVPIEPQERRLRQGVDILVATPGRLKDHVWRGNLDFRHTRFLVLDEADRMLDMGFIKAVRELIELLPEERQSMLFSATVDEEIRRFAKGILRDPLRIEVAPPSSTLEEVDQFLVQATRREKRSVLESLIRSEGMERAIIFSRTKSGASRLAMELREHGHKASAIHSDRSQAERVRALEGFREGRIQILVATDIAARGIDVQDVSHVVNFDLPHTPKDYVHRIGRTARAGRRGRAISIVTPDDSAGVASIERLIHRRLQWLDEPGRMPSSRDADASQASGLHASRRRASPASSASRHPAPVARDLPSRAEGFSRARRQSNPDRRQDHGGARPPARARGRENARSHGRAREHAVSAASHRKSAKNRSPRTDDRSIAVMSGDERERRRGGLLRLVRKLTGSKAHSTPAT